MLEPTGQAAVLVERIARGDHRAIARAITLIENEQAAARDLLRQLHSLTGRAHVIGVTGPPGAGKSTLVQRLAVELRKSGRTVAIIAIDPTSPFTGGALLGDRIRMEEGLQDPGIFMRSLASRGRTGGLSQATADVVSLLDAAGFQAVLVETVGAGQAEVEIMRLAHTTVVVSVPGLGDELQAEKSGILEIADVFVVNKADRTGADRVANDLSSMLTMVHMGAPGHNRWPTEQDARISQPSRFARDHLFERFGSPVPGEESWHPPVVSTAATTDLGTTELAARLDAHRGFLVDAGRWNRKARSRLAERIRDFVQTLAVKRFFDHPRAEGRLEALLDEVASGRRDPFDAASSLLAMRDVTKDFGTGDAP